MVIRLPPILLTLCLFLLASLSMPSLIQAVLQGQIVRDPANPARIIYQDTLVGSHPKPTILCGAGDPEDFFYNNTQANLDLLISRGAKTTYITAYLKDFGGGNPGTGTQLDTTLTQWESYLTQLENAGITTVFFFFDDTQGLPTDWEIAVDKIVNKFKHHKLLIWSVAEEFGEALTVSQVSQVAARIRQADENAHLVGVHQNHGTSFAFNADPNLDMFLIQYNVASAQQIHDGVKQAWANTQGKKVLNLAEVAGHSRQTRATVRQWNWAAIMGGASIIQVFEMGRASDPAEWNDPQKYADCGVLVDFFEATDINSMALHDELAAGGTQYVLANPGKSYIAYASNLSGNISLTGMTAGSYDFTWLDIPTGSSVIQKNVSVGSGLQSFTKPAGIGAEVAVSITLPATVFPGANWATSTPEAQGIDAAKLNSAMTYLASVSGSQDTSQAVVVRNGYVIWQGSDIDNSHNVWSVSKSFTSTVLGLLIDDGKAALSTQAKTYVSPLSSLYSNVTLRHFATMTSGYDGGGDQSDTPFTPTAPLFAPGTKFQYWDSAMNQFGNVLTQAAGESMYSLFKRRIADPIGMNPTKWSWGNWGTIDGLLVNGGAGNKSKGISTSAREAARFGHLFLNRGNWNGIQLISTSWVDQATSPQVPSTIPSHTSGADGPGVYGYNWWTNGIKPDGQREWPNAPTGTYQAAGYNNNRIIIIPEWQMVIVRLGTDGSSVDNTELNTFLNQVKASLLTVPTTPTTTPSPTPTPIPPPPTGDPTPTPLPGDGLVSNLTVASGQAYEVVVNGLAVGALQYLDRSFTFSMVPSQLVGLTYIKTANDDKASTGDNFLSFTVSVPVTLFVAHDDRISPRPVWLSDFSDTGDNLISGGGTFSLFAKEYPQGPITLGGNEGGGNSMYSVILLPHATPLPGDLDGDSDTDIFDLFRLVLGFNQPGTGDFNANGKVDIFDFNSLINFIHSQ